MAAILDVYFKEDSLEKMLELIKKGNWKGISVSVAVNDSLSQYGENVGVYIKQTKEERESKGQKHYVGNGTCVWTDGSVKTAKELGGDALKNKSRETTGIPESKFEKVNEDDLPF